MVRSRARSIATVVGLGLLAGGSASGVSRPAHARATGLSAPGCVGCHASEDHAIELLPEPEGFEPGDRVGFRLRLSSPTGSNAGAFVHSEGVGALVAVSGGGLVARGSGLTHPSPRPLEGGVVELFFEWVAPQAPGAVRFDVSSVVGNGNGGSSGDRAASAFFDFVYGCERRAFYLDADGDGFGRATSSRLGCEGAAPEFYVDNPDDCDDTRQTAYPGAQELCNERDDDCNGAIDDDYEPVPQYPDGDGDGFYGAEEGASEDTFLGCPEPGYASERGDCQPGLAEIHPAAEEVCNLYDDNCDGRVDELVRPACGVGWCRRLSPTCEAEACVPGEPMPELCNLLDDDCDGSVDEGETCPAGQVCEVGVCVAGSSRPDPTATGGPAAGSESGAGLDEGGSTSAGAAVSRGGGCGVHPGTPGPGAAWIALLGPLGLAARRRTSVQCSRGPARSATDRATSPTGSRV